MPKISPWQAHRAKWLDCTRCLLCNGRTQVVLARGEIPAPILFIGEAPGESEDVIGQPMVGPAGHLLNYIIEQAIDGQYDYCITNLIACIPRGEDGSKTNEPPQEAIDACSERLREMLEICKPELVVYVGKLAAKHAHQWVECRSVEIVHPASILRADESQKGLSIQRAIIILSDAVDEIGSE